MTDAPVRQATWSGLTARQSAVLAAITGHIGEHGYPPTMREVAATAGLRSSAAAAYQINRLAEFGYVARCPGKARALAVTAAGGLA